MDSGPGRGRRAWADLQRGLQRRGHACWLSADDEAEAQAPQTVGRFFSPLLVVFVVYASLVLVLSTCCVVSTVGLYKQRCRPSL